ncbi:MAG: alpha/beta hydrolase [Gammaproteobacteria bacterium]|nr:alpha/beta hydrolase [Gammaproteobacteria bacterium]
MLRRILFGLAGLLVIAIGSGLWLWRDIPGAEIEKRYANAASRFVTIDGVRFHYRDEGSGPTVVLLHANFSNMIDWDPWVEALRDRYRVVRFDFTSHGLTGPDPTGDYTQERTLALTEKLIDELGLERISIAGTSMGGTMAIHYTAKHPDRVERLILLSPGSLEGRERKERSGQIPRFVYVLARFLPRALPEAMLTDGFGQPENLPPALIDRWHDLWRREGNREAQLDRLSQYEAGDIESVVRSIGVPVLLLWGEKNTTAVFTQAAEFRELLHDAPSLTFISYPQVGHMAVEEAGPAIGRDVRAWLDGPAEVPQG